VAKLPSSLHLGDELVDVMLPEGHRLRGVLDHQ
jgi:hypothetical protein